MSPARSMPSSARRWERAAMVGLVAAILAAVALSADQVTERSRRAMEREVQAGEQLAATERAAELAAAIQAAQERVAVSAGYDVVRIAVEARSTGLLNAALEQAARGPGVTAGSITAADGEVVAQVGELHDLVPGEGVHFHPAEDRRDAYVSFAEPIAGGVGWLHQEFSVRGLVPRLTQPIPYVEGAVTLLERDGGVLLTTADRVFEQVRSPELLELLAAGEPSTAIYESLELDRRRVVAVAPVPGTDLLAIVGADHAAAGRPASDLVFRLTVVLAVTLVVVGVLLAGLVWLLVRTRRRLAAERRAADELALTDALTGLPNRRAFDRALAEAERRGGGSTAVIVLDLDHLKSINDGGGHADGDEALRLVAAAIRSSVRPDDLVARIGGDEFAVLLPDTPLPQAEQTAARAVDAVRAVAVAPYGSLSASAGSASGPSPQVRTTVVDADRRLYDAKRARI